MQQFVEFTTGLTQMTRLFLALRFFIKHTHKHPHIADTGTNRLTQIYLNNNFHVLTSAVCITLDYSLTDIKNSFYRDDQYRCFSKNTHLQKSHTGWLDSIELGHSCKTQHRKKTDRNHVNVNLKNSNPPLNKRRFQLWHTKNFSKNGLGEVYEFIEPQPYGFILIDQIWEFRFSGSVTFMITCSHTTTKVTSPIRKISCTLLLRLPQRKQENTISGCPDLFNTIFLLQEKIKNWNVTSTAFLSLLKQFAIISSSRIYCRNIFHCIVHEYNIVIQTFQFLHPLC